MTTRRWSRTGRVTTWLLRLCLVVLPLLVAAVQARAQEGPQIAVSDTLYEVRLTGGESYVGRVVAVESDAITLESTAGVRIRLTRAQIASIRPARGRVEGGVLWREDHNRTRLFFAPTGRPVPAGEGYVGVFELFFPFVSYGVTDRITISGGTPIIPEVIGRVYYLAPKVGIVSTPTLNLSAGVLGMINLEETDEEPVGILYGVGTWGSDDRALTGGAGWTFSGSDLANRPVFMAGGESRISPRIKLITENYLVSWRTDSHNPRTGQTTSRVEYMGMLSGGVRIFGERLSADAGLGVALGDSDFHCCLPLVNFVYSFGGGR